jgi:cell division protein FtsB
MIRGLLAFVVLAAVTAALGYRWYSQDVEFHLRQEKQIAELNQQVNKLQADNSRLKGELAKVQDEESRLVAANEMLRKAIEQAMLSGKAPRVEPYPPK